MKGTSERVAYQWAVERTLRDARVAHEKELIAKVEPKYRPIYQRALNDWNRRRGFIG